MFLPPEMSGFRNYWKPVTPSPSTPDKKKPPQKPPRNPPTLSVREMIGKLEEDKGKLNSTVLEVSDDCVIQRRLVKQLEAELLECQASEQKLTISLQEAQDQALVFKTGKEELFLAVVKLNNRIEVQNKTDRKSVV